ncbi:MAG TPA: 23S rRNA (adenine(2503)-C(2))-methyltransferase RlmN [Bacillota bacterium]|nr:23S rRNA (adenine(2503)-C(2))-methyltransferase RlmN [Bacillota bacterium]
MTAKPDLLSMTIDEMKSLMNSLDEDLYRGKQLFKWLHSGILSYDHMTNLPKKLIGKLDHNYIITNLKQLRLLQSADGHTRKYLYLLSDKNIIECVTMKYNYGTTLCLSTQVGCKMGCSFCASTTGGLIRDLTAGEMLAQVLHVNNALLSQEYLPIRGLVLMGSGEPLDNYKNTLKFLHLVHQPEGLNIGYRNITLSTCGLVPEIRGLAKEGININLAVSLHAPNDTLRKQIMKIAQAYSVKEVIDASRYYFDKTGRRVTFEYALIDGINDKLEHAKELGELLKGFPCHINIIPLNEVDHSDMKKSNENSLNVFIKTLELKGVNVTRRREMGLDIDGACGQLKASYMGAKGK